MISTTSRGWTIEGRTEILIESEKLNDIKDFQGGGL